MIISSLLVSFAVTVTCHTIQLCIQHGFWIVRVRGYQQPDRWTPPYIYVGAFQLTPCEHEFCPVDECRVHDRDRCFVRNCEKCEAMALAEFIARPGEKIILPSLPTNRIKQPSLDCTICSCPPDDYCVPAREPDWQMLRPA